MCEICFNRSNWPKRAPRGIKYITDPQCFLNLNIFSEHTCPLYSTLITLYRFYKREICICRITWRHVTFYMICCKKKFKRVLLIQQIAKQANNIPNHIKKKFCQKSHTQFALLCVFVIKEKTNFYLCHVTSPSLVANI